MGQNFYFKSRWSFLSKIVLVLAIVSFLPIIINMMPALFPWKVPAFQIEFAGTNIPLPFIFVFAVIVLLPRKLGEIYFRDGQKLMTRQMSGSKNRKYESNEYLVKDCQGYFIQEKEHLLGKEVQVILKCSDEYQAVVFIQLPKNDIEVVQGLKNAFAVYGITELGLDDTVLQDYLKEGF